MPDMPLAPATSRRHTSGNTRKEAARRFSEGNNTLDDVEIFSAGTHRDKEYTRDDLDAMVENFKRFCTGQKPGFRVPLVLGHEETQEFLDRSDLPAAGWASRVWRDGDKLKADFEDVPEQVARLLRGKAYRTVSSEVYDQPPEGLDGQGKMLRRVALLGGDIPQLKNLEEIPAPRTHSERRRFAPYRRVRLAFTGVKPSATPGAFHCFHEAKSMAKKFDEAAAGDSDKMLDYLSESGMDREALKGAPPEALAEMCRAMSDDAGEEETPVEKNDDMPEGDAGGSSDQYADDPLPEIEDADEAKKYADKIRRYADHAKSMMKKFGCSMEHAEGDGGASSETPVSTETAQPKKTTVTHQYKEQDIEAIAMRVATSVIEKALPQVQGKINEFERFTETQLAAQKKAAIEAFCETGLKAGKIMPFELDRDNPANLYDRLMRADAKAPVRKYKEGKKEITLTELDLQMKEIEQRPARIFSERVKSGKGGSAGSKGAPDAEVEKVEEAFEKFSEKFPKGVQKESIVAGFKAEKKHHPDLTAEDFLEGFGV